MTLSFSLVPHFLIIKYDSPKMSVIMLMAELLHFYLRLVSLSNLYHTIPLFTRICTFQILEDLFVAVFQQNPFPHVFSYYSPRYVDPH